LVKEKIMAKIRKYALGGVAGVSAPAQGTTPAATTQQPTGSLFNTLSNMTPMSSNQVAASNQMADQMRTRAAPMPAPYAGPGTPIPSLSGNNASLPNFGPQGGPMGRPGMGGPFGPMGGPMGRFGGRFGGLFGPMGRGTQFGPGMPTGRGGGINPGMQVPPGQTLTPILPMQPTPYNGNPMDIVTKQQMQAYIDSFTAKDPGPTMPTPQVTPTQPSDQMPTGGIFGQTGTGGTPYNTIIDAGPLPSPGAYKKGGAVNAYKKGGSIKSMDSKPSKNYTTDGGRLNLGSGRVSTAQKNKKSPSW
jgi:hypothetical protein